ncbi:hypothetical protein [Symmachiella dynata]|uniref:flagellar basal body rod protein FlgB n=1 Tax=Symmachiella dynata TaxID=2527995 RepID=UPI0030EB20A7
MINSILQSTTVPLLEQVASFTERRQEILAGNMANINTDDYRMRDLDVKKFQSLLREAIELRSQPKQSQSQYPMPPFPSPGLAGGGQTTQPDIADLFTPEVFEAVQAPPYNLTFQDGNNRSIEEEAMEMTKNGMLQSYAIEFINAQMALLQQVISERV